MAILKQISHKNPACVLGFATGSTPIGTYQQLIEMHKAGDISFKEVTPVNLDEYKGLSGDHDRSYRCFMNDSLFNHVVIDKAFTFAPNRPTSILQLHPDIVIVGDEAALSKPVEAGVEID